MADKKDEEEKHEEGQETEEEALLAKKKKKKKKLIIIIAVVVLLVGGGAGAYFSGVFAPQQKVDDKSKKGKKKKGKEGEEAAHGTTGSSVKSVKQNLNDWVPGIVPGHEDDDVAYYNLPEFIVNLNTGGKQTSFIKMKATMEVPADTDIDAVESRMPRITDSFNTYLRELRSSDIAGSAGLYRLREELLLRVNKTIYPNKINDILFREIIVQ